MFSAFTTFKIIISDTFLPLLHSTLNPCTLISSNSTHLYERKTAKINVKKL